jgi:hypothetical protein
MHAGAKQRSQLGGLAHRFIGGLGAVGANHDRAEHGARRPGQASLTIAMIMPATTNTMITP